MPMLAPERTNNHSLPHFQDHCQAPSFHFLQYTTLHNYAHALICVLHSNHCLYCNAFHKSMYILYVFFLFTKYTKRIAFLDGARVKNTKKLH